MPEPTLKIESRKSKWSVGDLFAVEAMRPLEGGYIPWTSFSLRPAALQTILNEVAVREPASVLELGSGASTVMIARLLRHCDYGGRLVSVESDPDWAGTIGKLIEKEDLGTYAKVVCSPLREWSGELSDAETEFDLPTQWYETEAVVDALAGTRIDLLIVDGPTGGPTLSRYPAVFELSEQLSESAVIVLDDANRPAEREIARQWSSLLGLRFTIYERMALAIGRRAGGFSLLGG